MKRLVMAVVAVGVAGLMGGCASPGGMTYIGPVSYLHAKSADKAMMMRSAAVSAKIPAEKKEPVFKAVSLGAGPNEVALGVEVDVFALTSSDYTTGEKVMQFISALVDMVIYGGAAYGVSEAAGGSSTKSVTTYTILNNGNGNNNNVNGGSGSQQNNSASDGAANGDVSVAP